MKRYQLLILAIFFPLCIFAQSGGYKDYISKGDNAVARGQYEDAKKQYEAAKVLLKKTDPNLTSNEGLTITKKANKAFRCIDMMSRAEAHFQQAENEKTEAAYERAKQSYQAIVSEQASDRYSRDRIAYCNAKMEQIALSQLDKQTWAKIHSLAEPSKETYLQYIANFPEGMYVKDAQRKVAMYEDEELWATMKKRNNKESYLSYINKSKLGTYKSEAQMAINRIDDKDAWQKALSANTIEAYNAYIKNEENPAKQYQREAIAQRSKLQTMIDIKARQNQPSETESAASVVQVLEEAAKVADLSVEEKNILAQYKQIDDYVNFTTNPTITAGLQFFGTYPNSKYDTEVSNKLSELYANKLSAYSTETDYKRALSYARTDDVKKYVQKKISASKQDAKNAQRIRTQASQSAWKQQQKTAKAEQREINSQVRRQNWSDRFQLGLGIEGEATAGSMAWGPKLEFKLGAATNAFNFAFGAKYLNWNPEYVFSDALQNITMTQIPTYAYMKFNLFKTGTNGRFFIAGEGAYNFNLKANYRTADTEGYYKDNSMLYKNNITATGRMGFCWPHGEFSFYYKHNISSPFDQDYMTRNYPEIVIDNQITAPFMIGISYTCYIIF